MMKKTIMFIAVLAIGLGVLHSAPVAAQKELAKGDALPAIKLPVPRTPAAKSYLGLTNGETFAVSQIKAEVLIIEIFNMYCSYCQGEAPLVNEFYQLINKDPNLKKKIKVIGIGAGNTPLEVEVFRKNYQVLFPLFPDEDYVIHKAVGEVRTPFFICAKRNTDGSFKVFHTNLGSFRDAAQFLKQVVTLSVL
jgi:thiol-disulfide isomerase/thioredoxin